MYLSDKEIEDYAIETVRRAAKKAHRMAKGGVEVGDVEGFIWERIAHLRDDPDRWNKPYLTTAIWRNAYNAHPKTVEPVLIVAEQEVQPCETYSDLYELIGSIKNPQIREVARLYAKGVSVDQIADRIGINKTSVNNKLTNAKRLLKKKIDTLTTEDQRAIQNGN